MTGNYNVEDTPVKPGGRSVGRKVAESGARIRSQETKGVVVLMGSLWSREETWKSSREHQEQMFPRDKELFGQMPK